MGASPEKNVKRRKVSARVLRDKVVVRRDDSDKDLVELLWSKSSFGNLEKDALVLSLIEALFLVESGKITVKNSKNEVLDYDSFMRRATRVDKRFFQRYVVFRDLRSRGYILKAALKYGADFTVYDRGKKPGKTHSKWLLFVASESEKYAWRSWVANNRVAHSVKKRILLAVIDDNNDVTYYEVSWKRP